MTELCTMEEWKRDCRRVIHTMTLRQFRTFSTENGRPMSDMLRECEQRQDRGAA